MKSRVLLIGLVVTLLVVAAVYFGTGDRIGPRGPDRPSDERTDLDAPPTFGDPIPPSFIPAEALAAAGGDPKPTEAAAGGKAPDPIAAAVGLVLRRLLPALNEANDPTAFLEGAGTKPWELQALPRPLVLKILSALDSDDAGTRLNAALVLSALELEPGDLADLRTAFGAELKGMHDRNTKNATLALAFALSTHGDRLGLARLGDALRNGSGDDVDGFRRDVVLVMGVAKDEASSSLLRDLLATDPDRAVRKNSAVGLGKIGGDENRTAIADALTRETDIEVRAWAALAAGRAAGEHGDDGTLAGALAMDTSGEVRAAAAYSLGRAGGDGTTATLIASFYGEDHALARVGAVAGLVRRGASGERATEFLANDGVTFLAETITGDPDNTSRYYAVATLAMMPRTDASSAALRHAATADGSIWVRQQAVTTLAKKEGRAALPALTAALAKEESKRVRREIERQIRRLSK